MSTNVAGEGLGCIEVVEKVKTSEKSNVWKITQERFQKLPECNTAFENASD